MHDLIAPGTNIWVYSLGQQFACDAVTTTSLMQALVMETDFDGLSKVVSFLSALQRNIDRCSPDLRILCKDGRAIRSAVSELAHCTFVSYLRIGAKAASDASLVMCFVQKLARRSGKHLTDEERTSLYTAADNIKVHAYALLAPRD